MLHFLITLGLTTALYILPLLILLPFKLKAVQKIILTLITVVILTVASLTIGNIGVIFLLAADSIYIALIDCHRLRNILLFLFSYFLNVVIGNILSVPVCLLADMNIEQMQETPIVLYPFTCFNIAVVYLICKLLVFLHNKFRSRMEIPPLPKKTVFFIALNFLLILCLFIINITAGEQIGYPPVVVTFNAIIFLLFFAVCVWTILQIIKTYKAAYEMNVKQENFIALQKYTKQVEDLYTSLRSFKHDYNNILISMTDYIDHRDIDGLSAYFHEHIVPETSRLMPDNYQLGRLANIKKPELKGFITAKLIYAQEMNIKTAIEAETPIETVAANIVDLTRILGIFLDNAIEAALETAKPQMTFTAIQSDSETVFIVSNNFIDHHLNISQLSRPDISSKGSGRGIGLYNASKIIDSYKNMFLETTISNGFFIQTLHISE